MKVTAPCALSLLLAVLPAGGQRPLSPLAAPGPVPVRLLLQWTHQSQFAGYYIALEKGIYARHGLQVTIMRGGPDRDGAQYLAQGKADLATLFLTTALTYRDRGLPIVLLAQIVNRSNAVVVAWKDRGITNLRDLDGRHVSVWGDQFAAPFLDFFQRNHVQPVIVPQYGSVELFLRHGVDACAAMEYNEVHRIYQAGVDPEQLTTFRLRDFGLGFPEDGIYCLQPFLAAHHETARAFAEASLEGWRYAASHGEEARDIALGFVLRHHVATNRPHSTWMLDTLLATIVPGPGDHWTMGQLLPEDYATVVSNLQQQGFIQRAVSYEEFCDRPVARSHAP